MEDRHFDDLARRLARPMSRRQVCKTILATTVGAVFMRSGVGQAFAANDDCAHFCDAVFPAGPDRGTCKSEAAQGGGICFQCGPAAGAGAPDVCGSGTSLATCCSTQTPSCCGGTCVDLTSDSNNCGSCGKVCSAGSTCVNSTCMATSTCSTGSTCGNFVFGCNGCDTCLCYHVLGGGVNCGQNVSCTGYTPCNATNACASGEFCAVDTCCAGTDPNNGVCVPIVTAASAVLSPAVLEGPTAAGF